MDKKVTRYLEVNIIPSHSGFGEWIVPEPNGEPRDDADDLLDEIRQAPGVIDVYELKDDLPESIDDIRGRIHNQPDRVFALLLDDDEIRYFGIDEIEETQEAE